MAVPSFPTLAGITYKFPRSMAFASARHQSISGMRSTTALRSQPTWTWTIPVAFLRGATFPALGFTEFETLTAFIGQQVSQGFAFGYTDPGDYAVTNQNFGQGDGTTVAFQLVRSFGGFTQPVYLATPTSVAVAGSVTTAYTLSAKGVVTFATAPAAGAALTWTGSFQWLCTFDKDSFKFEQFMQGLYTTDDLTFSSLINP